MDRRVALQRVGLLIGGSVLGANAFLTGCKSPEDKDAGEKVAFSQPDIAYLDEIAETIIPTTATPGAKAAKVGTFMTVMVSDCYSARDQKIFREGMDKINELSKKKFDKDFMSASTQQRLQLLTELDKEAKEEQRKQKEDRDNEAAANKQKQEEERTEQKRNPTQESEKTKEEKQQEKPREDPPRHYFRMMRELTLLGYFTSEIGATQALRYQQVPGRYDACVPYKKGDKLWA
jgi:hypothetical protein